MRYLAITLPLLLLLMSAAIAPVQAAETRKYPDVVDVAVTEAGAGRYHFDVTLSSPYDSPERYADAFRVSTPEGKTLGVRKLLHHHANEQPFTRSLRDVAVPEGVSRVVVEGRDQQYGYGGETVEAALPAR
ncbi:hypothetical protein [Marinobacter sp. AN1]|uniref:hypothetical protein n=1 Tax=Marinobacter sp. AN1 TaxID=2886046 RepID=UPI0022325060|nr:hypothetical protein [Marinobacter sp. AN1]UZD66766.1 hypothetical protein LJ360_05325 [Marinobacter sp. AN1]